MGENLVAVDWKQDYFYFYEKYREKDKTYELYKKSLGNIINSRYTKKKNSIENLISGKKNIGLENIFENKSKKMAQKEEKLFENIYKKLGFEQSKSVSYSSLSPTQKINLWTNLINFGMIKTDTIISKAENYNQLTELTPKYCFRIIASSQEFSNAMRTQTRGQSISRKKFYQSLNDGKGEKYNAKEVERKMMDFFKSVGKPIDKKVAEEITEEIMPAAEEIFKGFNLIGKNDETKNKIKKEIKDLLKNDEKNYEEYHNVLRRGLVKIANDNNINAPILVKHNDKDPAYIVIDQSSEQGAFQQAYSKDEDKNLKESFYIAIGQAINKLKKRRIEEQKFNLVAIGNVELEKSIYEYFYDKAIIFYKSNVKQIINSLTLPNYIDYGSGVIGLIGEFIGKIGIRSVGEVIHTGAKQDIVNISGKEIKLGESFQDLLITGIGGINIKHYMSDKSAKSISLYKSDGNGFNVLSKYSYKHFPSEVAAILRFLDINYNIFVNFAGGSSYSLSNIYKNISILNFNNFIRATTGQLQGQEDDVNVLYQLSNLIVPTSVVYSKIAKLAGSISNLQNLFDIEIKRTDYDILKTPKKLNQEFVNDHLLNSDKIFNKKGSRIKFKGWTINFSELLGK